MRKICLIFALLTFLFIRHVDACTPLDVPNFLSQSISGTNLLLNWESTNVWVCSGYTIEVEIKCANAAFSGVGPFYQTAELIKTTTGPQAYPQQTIDISSFCPGQVYNFRARELWIGTVGAWSSVFTFTVPGIPNQPALTLSASASTICSGQSSQLSSLSNGCGQAAYAYSWFPATGLSCTNCPNPVASPTIATTYTCYMEGDQTTCWSVNNSITIYMNTISSPGTVVATSSVCAGNSATVGVNGGGPINQWQYSTDGGTTWSAAGFSNTTSFSTGTLGTNQCYRVVVSTCGQFYTSLPQCITVYNLPQINITSSSLFVCEGDSAILTATGAQDYLWTNSSFSTGSVLVVSPFVTTTYFVNGTDINGCSNTSGFTQDAGICTGLYERNLSNNEWTILPNPSSGSFSIKSNVAGQFTIMNELGQIMRTITLDESNNNTISQQQLSPGIYFIFSASGSGKKILVSN